MDNLRTHTAATPELDEIHSPGFPLCRTVFRTRTMTCFSNLRIVRVNLSEHPDSEHIDSKKTKCTISNNPIL